jgi:hypothetical protein
MNQPIPPLAQPNATKSVQKRAAHKEKARTVRAVKALKTQNHASIEKLNLITSAEKRQYLQALVRAMPGQSARTQCQRLREALGRYAISTFEAMRYLDVYYCPARIMQLRKRGLNITTAWVTVATESGYEHRVGLYVLEVK